ncbi:MAG: 2-dehydro-3-deoxy-L-rhamnonate dehydrogenase [Microbacteriaceae bacterium]|jgi:3-oxoacyl-[acyl-carrier protein] reductase|nr:2-dehydro-3-deoxy-L-rhamnonate dehydrogenase [Microbacteriaceae bacterium]MDT4904821.1 2-dehydro-3-deoxy-L-rhamnonate dehydrogenase [Pseudonocardiales bacterium]
MVDLGLVGMGAIVTGGASGIGAAIGARLAADGCRVALLDTDEAGAAAMASTIGAGTAIGVRCDVRSGTEVAAAVETVAAEFGRIDILINNAGILGPIMPLVDVPEDEFVKVIDIDLVGTYRVTHHVLPHMLARSFGRIVNIASISGKEGNPMMTAYASAKAGVLGLTKSLGKELAMSGIIVNCVTPGAVMHTNIMQGREVETASELVSEHPMGRYAEPHEVAAMVAWLCSSEASYSTGAVFDISGGRAMY